MFAKLFCAVTVSAATLSDAHCAELASSPVPPSVMVLEGCWEGSGDVTGKPVALAVNAYLIVQDAMLAIEAVSSAISDPKDQYSAHLVFGGTGKQSESEADQIVGYWADSFGGAFAAPGRGLGGADGFEITYQYPDDAFVNRWRVSGDRLTWQIAVRDRKGVEKPFASYVLRKAKCGS
jgi:hypothetical protein